MIRRYDSLPDERSLRSTDTKRNCDPVSPRYKSSKVKVPEGRAARVRKNLGEGKNLSLEFSVLSFSPLREEDKIVKLVSIEEEKF